MATAFQILRLLLFLSAMVSLSRSRAWASASLSSGSSTGLPNNTATVVSRTSAKRTRRSASGTDRPCSHLDTVCRTTWSRDANSSWVIPFCLRRALRFSLNMSLTSFPPHHRITWPQQQATQMHISALSKAPPIKGGAFSPSYGPTPLRSWQRGQFCSASSATTANGKLRARRRRIYFSFAN